MGLLLIWAWRAIALYHWVTTGRLPLPDPLHRMSQKAKELIALCRNTHDYADFIIRFQNRLYAQRARLVGEWRWNSAWRAY